MTRRAALAGVSFEVGAGEAVGIIGPNGAGKSTALRLAARITRPTDGVVRVRGRVGALIEVGAGIHPELTGRENVWLYGAILGLSRRTIAARFDDIVAFAELEQALDMPVKRYSSGMQLRLGFSIAAAVTPDVLVVDEALAVGDARFQVRCLERMAALVRDGAAVVYVSHDLASVQTSCRRALLLVDGVVNTDGPVDDTISRYLHWIAQSGDGVGGDCILGPDGQPRTVLASGDPLTVRVPVDAAGEQPVNVALGIRDGNPWNILGSSTTVPAGSATRELRCHIPALPLDSGVYEVWISIEGEDPNGSWRKLGAFRVTGGDERPRPVWLPPITMSERWEPVAR
jgi:ABC-type polysaccharide/polyol phosphate transport system ATPase subunit